MMQICVFVKREETLKRRTNGPLAIKILSSLCFQRRRGTKQYQLHPDKVGTESFTSSEKSWNCTAANSGCILVKSVGQFVFNLCLICETTLRCWQTQIIRFSAIVVGVVVGDVGHGICSARPSWFVDAFVGCEKVWKSQLRSVKTKRHIYILCENVQILRPNNNRPLSRFDFM